MSIDKKIDYVEQDGSLNFIKNSESVTVPKRFKARKEAPAVKLAYITDAEAKMLKKKKPGTPHKGPKGIPSYDTFGSIDSSGRDTGVSGAAASAAETGSRDARDIREMQAQFNTGNLGPGVTPKQARDLRLGAIAAGAGQRVNPGFFDSKNVLDPQLIRDAKRFNPRAFYRGRRGTGLASLFSGGGILGNLIRGIGRIFGLGKKYNEPTYDMSRFSGLPLGGSAPFKNLDIRDKFNRKDGIITLVPSEVTTENVDADSDTREKYEAYLLDAPPQPLTFEEFKNAVEGIKEGTLPNTSSTSMFTVPNAADLIIPVGDTGSALTTPVEGLFGLNLIDTRTLQRGGYTDSQIREAVEGGYAEELANSLKGQLGV